MLSPPNSALVPIARFGRELLVLTIFCAAPYPMAILFDPVILLASDPNHIAIVFVAVVTLLSALVPKIRFDRVPPLPCQMRSDHVIMRSHSRLRILSFSILLVLKTTSCVSVVPRKFVPAIVPVFPVSPHHDEALVAHTGEPPLIVSTCPFVPFTSQTVFPARVSPLLKVRRSPKSPVVVLYEIPPVTEREVRLILLLKIFQSMLEREPVVEVEASPMESPVPTRESPLAGERRESAPCLLEKVFQSAAERAPTVALLARAREIC